MDHPELCAIRVVFLSGALECNHVRAYLPYRTEKENPVFIPDSLKQTKWTSTGHRRLLLLAVRFLYSHL